MKKYVEIFLHYRWLFIKGDIIIGEWEIFGVEVFLRYSQFFVKGDFVIGRVERMCCEPSCVFSLCPLIQCEASTWFQTNEILVMFIKKRLGRGATSSCRIKCQHLLPQRFYEGHLVFFWSELFMMLFLYLPPSWFFTSEESLFILLQFLWKELITLRKS